MWDCYDENTHTCDGRCQGCTDCPMAYSDVQVSKRVMKAYIKKSIEDKKNWDALMKELESDEVFQAEIKKITEEFYKMKGIEYVK